MSYPLSCWNPRRWYRELRDVWYDTRLLVLSAQIAAIYAAVLIPFKVGIPIIPGFVELRPANVIPIVSSLLFGPAAAWGSGIGNVIGDCFGTLGPASVFGFLGNFLYGYVPYLLWGNLGWVSSGKEARVHTAKQWLEYIIICLAASCACAATIGWGVELLGLLPFWLLTPAIFLNNIVMALLLGPPLLFFLYPRVKQWNLFYRDLIFIEQERRIQRQFSDFSCTLGAVAASQVEKESEALLSIQNLTFQPTYSSQPVLSSISLNIQRGELVVIMGRTGSGKSTLCYAINGLVPQFVQGTFRGSIMVNGSATTKTPVWEQANRVGIVFQDFETQLVSTNVETELCYALESQEELSHGLDDASVRQHIKNILELVGLTGLERHDPFSLSGGQRQRLVVGSVLVREPQVLVMDQPLTDLDPAGKRTFIQLLKTLKQKGVTILIVEHAVQNLTHADRVCVLDEGRLTWQGTPQEILSQPKLASRHGLSPFTLAECFQGFDLLSLPTTLEEAWHFADHLGLEIRSLRSDMEVPISQSLQAQENVIEFINVSFQYQSRALALDNVTVAIGQGEFVALLGQNGSGKSTFAKLLNGLLQPSEGRVLVMGQDTQYTGVGQLASIVGHVFQNPDHQIFAETVKKEIAFGARNAGCSTEECDARVKEALQAVGLSWAEECDPFSLTKGERQRVAVASILAAKPKILIVDEPTTGLDAEESVRMMNMIQSLNQQGHTILMITHDMSLVTDYATRCVLMKNGTILGNGPTRKIFSDPNLIRSASLDLPDLIRFTQRWGETLLTVDEVKKALRPI